ncbi:MAG TPA: hypothetical protein VF057_01525 [Thermoanaerobaculia bacterium]
MEATIRRNPFECLQVLLSPFATVASLKEKPRHFVAVLIASAYATLLSSWIVQRVGLENILRNTMQASGSVDADTMLANAMQYKTQILWTQALSTFVGTLTTAYFVGVVLWLIVTIAGEDVRLKTVNAVVAHSALFYAVVKYTMFAISVGLSRNPAAINIKNPLATNGAFFLQTGSYLLQHVIRSFDAIVLAAVVLLIVGLRSVSRKLSPVTASLIVLVPWLAYVIVGGLLSSPS